MNSKMKHITAVALLGISLSCSLTSQAQQNPMFSQYMFNMMNINPAYTGQREVGNLNILWRNQWVSFPGAPQTGSITYDQNLNEKNGSLGAQFYYDKIGIEKTTGMHGYYSYTAPFSNTSSLSLGFSLGLLNYSTDYTQTNPFDQGDPYLLQNVRGTLPTAGFGALWSGKKWFVGFSTPSLFRSKIYSTDQPKIQAAGKETHYFLNGGYSIQLDNQISLRPSMLLKAVSGTPVQADLNCNVWFGKVFGAGVSYRTSDAVLGMLEVQMTPQLRLGYAYDYNTSNLVNYNRGSHELMLRMDFKKHDEEADVKTPFFYYVKPAPVAAPPAPEQPKDSDGDGVTDDQDACPGIAGVSALKGCPDKDGDGISDEQDECPNEAGSNALNGCPDKDGDGIPDAKDDCPDQKGLAAFNGCADRDNDGIPDSKDKCPDQAGVTALSGCPIPDKDKDGVPDEKDRCPDVAGESNNAGCPALEKLNFNSRNVTFVTGSSSLTPQAITELNKLIEILGRFPQADVSIEGHTDNVGNAAANQALSARRAEAVKAYLVSKGIGADRLTATGYGQERPVADNSTINGRAENRRVDFTFKN
jgi:type IX secretion system PorP/SprF family membrane protein